LQFLQQTRISYSFCTEENSDGEDLYLQHHPVEDLANIADSLEGAALAWQYVRLDKGQAVPASMTQD
jgi:hypothetical protein